VLIDNRDARIRERFETLDEPLELREIQRAAGDPATSPPGSPGYTIGTAIVTMGRGRDARR